MVRYLLKIGASHRLVVPRLMMLHKLICCIFFPDANLGSKCFCIILSFIHQYCMSNSLEIFYHMLDVRIAWNVLLPVSNGVPFGGSLCTSSMHDIHIGQHCMALK